jgi:hypothetical protein
MRSSQIVLLNVMWRFVEFPDLCSGTIGGGDEEVGRGGEGEVFGLIGGVGTGH